MATIYRKCLRCGERFEVNGIIRLIPPKCPNCGARRSVLWLPKEKKGLNNY